MSDTIVYVSHADSQDIRVLRLDPEAGRLAELQSVPTGGQVMPMVVSPDRRVLHAAIRSEPYRVASFRIDAASGRLEPVGEAPLPHSMAYLATDRTGRWLFGASYPGHLMSVSPIGADGVPQAPSTVLPTGRNAHAVLVDPANRHVLVSNLGSDAVMQFGFDAATGLLAPAATPAWTSRTGAGPRHLVMHPDGRHVLLLNELDATVDLLAYDAERGALETRASAPTLPPGFDGKPWAADLHLTPDGRHLYTSERTSSTLAAFAVDVANERLVPLGHTATETQPRGFDIDPSGRFLIAVGQVSNAATLYAIDPASGALAVLQQLALGRAPTWVTTLAMS